jgi:kinetochor protein Mis14/NSL1
MTSTTSTSHHRRIELQSPADLAHLYTLISAAATQKIDLHLPPSAAPAGVDELRAKVEALVSSYVDETWRLCRTNLSVNGVDLDSSQAAVKGGLEGAGEEEALEEYEALDMALRERLADVIGRKNELVARVAEMRRQAPRVAAERFQREYLGRVEVEEAGRKAEEERVGQVIKGEEMLGLGPLERWDEVGRAWEGAAGGLGMLKGGLPEQRARLERAQGVVGYLEGK